MQSGTGASGRNGRAYARPCRLSESLRLVVCTGYSPDTGPAIEIKPGWRGYGQLRPINGRHRPEPWQYAITCGPCSSRPSRRNTIFGERIALPWEFGGLPPLARGMVAPVAGGGICHWTPAAAGRSGCTNRFAAALTVAKPRLPRRADCGFAASGFLPRRRSFVSSASSRQVALAHIPKISTPDAAPPVLSFAPRHFSAASGRAATSPARCPGP